MNTRNTLTCLLAAAMLLAAASGCRSTRQNLSIHPVPAPQVVGLEARDVVAILERAGLNDLQIIQVARDVRNSLALQGSAQVKLDRQVQVLLTVEHPRVHVMSRDRGRFSYDYMTHTVR